MASANEVIEVQKARLLTIVDGELRKLTQLSNSDNLLDRDARSMLETLARLLKQLQVDHAEDVGKEGHLSPEAIKAALRPTAP